MELPIVALAVLLVLANGFFVAAEFAMVTIRPSRLQTLIDEGRPGAVHAWKMVQRMDAYLSATQFGVTLASLGLGWIGQPAFARLFEAAVRNWLPNGVVKPLSHTLAVVFAFTLITFLHIVFGELGPKSLAIQKTDATALACAWPMRAFYFLFYPAIWLLNALARRVLRLFGLRGASAARESHSEDELRTILATSAASGAITRSRADLLDRAFEMLEKTARQILVPRNQIIYLDLEEPLEKNIADARASRHTWLPVCRGSLDRVDGVANVKDLFVLLSAGELKSLSQVQRPVLFVPENVTLEQLLSAFRRRRAQMAVAVDEHGGTSGIVTLADVVAEVVGEAAEMGRKVEEVRTLPGGRLELPGTAQLRDLEERLNVQFEIGNGEVTTVGGYLMSKLGRIPEVGDKCRVAEYQISVKEMDGPRVVQVLIEPSPSLPPLTPSAGH